MVIYSNNTVYYEALVTIC